MINTKFLEYWMTSPFFCISCNLSALFVRQILLLPPQCRHHFWMVSQVTCSIIISQLQGFHTSLGLLIKAMKAISFYDYDSLLFHIYVNLGSLTRLGGLLANLHSYLAYLFQPKNDISTHRWPNSFVSNKGLEIFMPVIITPNSSPLFIYVLTT